MGAGATRLSPGALLIAAACLCWAIDNNLTRKVAEHDALVVAGRKGLVAGGCNTALALATGPAWPEWPTLAAAMAVGFFGYGVSLALFVVGLRQLGTARTGAHFSLAPLFGVALALMAVGTVAHLREHHEHEHQHVPDIHHCHRH